MVRMYEVKIHLTQEQEEALRVKYNRYKKEIERVSWNEYLQMLAETAVIVTSRT